MKMVLPRLQQWFQLRVEGKKGQPAFAGQTRDDDEWGFVILRMMGQ